MQIQMAVVWEAGKKFLLVGLVEYLKDASAQIFRLQPKLAAQDASKFRA